MARLAILPDSVHKSGQKSERRTVRALPRIFSQTIHRLTRPQMEQMLPLLEAVLRAVPLWRMQCTIGEDAARLAYDAMRPKEEI